MSLPSALWDYGWQWVIAYMSVPLIHPPKKCHERVCRLKGRGGARGATSWSKELQWENNNVFYKCIEGKLKDVFLELISCIIWFKRSLISSVEAVWDEQPTNLLGGASFMLDGWEIPSYVTISSCRRDYALY